MKALRGKDLTGMKLGRLTVIRRAEDRDRIHWACVCECGNALDVMSSSLNKRNKPTRSCGCLRMSREFKSLPRGESAFNRLLRSYRIGAQKRNLEFSLTAEEFKKLIGQPCRYCGEPPNQKTAFKRANGQMEYNGVDRLDNSKGYTSDNSVSCCTLCNFLKGRAKEAEFIEHVLKVAAFQISSSSRTCSVPAKGRAFSTCKKETDSL